MTTKLGYLKQTKRNAQIYLRVKDCFNERELKRVLRSIIMSGFKYRMKYDDKRLSMNKLQTSVYLFPYLNKV